MTPPLAPVKGAQVSKVGRCQRRLSQKPQFVGVFFWKPSLNCYEVLWTVMNSYEQLWAVMNGYEQLWTVMNSYEQLWTVMNSYKLLGTVMNYY